MIYIEVIFGSINGNAIDVDAAMSDTSTNPVQNKVIKAALDALQRNIDAVAGSITKEVVEVETYDDLADIEEPRTDVIYATTDTKKLYLYDAKTGDFNDVTDKEIDNTIYVTNLDALFDMDLDAGMYAVSFTKRVVGGSTTTMYSLSVSASSRRMVVNGQFAVVRTTNMILANADGYAVKSYNDDDEPVWVWQMYSVEGHTHTTEEVQGLSTAIMNATSGKQDKTDNSLNTTDKTVVGAINEIKQRAESAYHQFTIDFQDTREVVQMRAIAGAITITKISADNVSTLKLAVNGGTQETLTLTNGVWTGSKSIAADALMAWQIGRTSEGSIAEINVQFNF